jgi:hypothetical protein
MARKQPARKAAKRATRRAAPKAKPARRAAARTSRTRDALTSSIKGVDERTVGGVRLAIARAGAARVKRVIYPAGFRWSKHMKPVTGTDRCMHAHVGFLARGRIHMEFADGCVSEYVAPQVVAIEPGHEGWVVGREPAVLIEFDFEKDTIAKLGMPEEHSH